MATVITTGATITMLGTTDIAITMAAATITGTFTVAIDIMVTVTATITTATDNYLISDGRLSLPFSEISDGRVSLGSVVCFLSCSTSCFRFETS
jgi:hypothetical protein